MVGWSWNACGALPVTTLCPWSPLQCKNITVTRRIMYYRVSGSRRVARGFPGGPETPPTQELWVELNVMRLLYRTVMPTVGNLRGMMRHYALYSQRAPCCKSLLVPDAKRNVCKVRMRIYRRTRALPRRKPLFEILATPLVTSYYMYICICGSQSSEDL